MRSNTKHAGSSGPRRNTGADYTLQDLERITSSMKKDDYPSKTTAGKKTRSTSVKRPQGLAFAKILPTRPNNNLRNMKSPPQQESRSRRDRNSSSLRKGATGMRSHSSNHSRPTSILSGRPIQTIKELAATFSPPKSRSGSKSSTLKLLAKNEKFGLNQVQGGGPKPAKQEKKLKNLQKTKKSTNLRLARLEKVRLFKVSSNLNPSSL